MFKRHISKYILILFLPAVLWLISNNDINKHYHILNCGKIIAHSHPYTNTSQSPIQDHNHSDFEYSILAHISSNSDLETTETVKQDLLLFPDLEFHGQIYRQYYKTTDKSKLQRLRAPPAF